MLNVNELTSRMAKMSDAQLRQYAQIHKNDPYTLALAASESKRRAQLRAGGQQQAAQQPTVADQAIAQMGAPAPMPQPQLPEQQGIGMLPAENVAGMADGGIAGYGDSYADEYASGGMVAFGRGGDVPGYADGILVGQGLNRTPMFAAPNTSFNTRVSNRMSELSQQGGPVLEGTFLENQIASMETALKTTPPGEQRNLIERNLTQLRNQVAANKAAAATPVIEQAQASPPPGTKFTNPNYVEPPDAAVPAPPRRQTGTGTRTSPGTGTTKDGKAGPEQMPGFTPGAAGDLTAEYKRMRGFLPDGSEYDTLATEAEKGFAKRAREREESKPKGKAYEGLEALLGKEEEKAKGKEAKNLNMALINAGLAIAGGRSQYALQNISEGALVGTKQYQEGLEKLEAAAVERRKQAAMIEESRRAEARGDWKEAEALKQQAFEAGLGIKRSKIEGLAKISGDTLKAAGERVNTLDTLRSQDQRAIYQQQMESERDKYKTDKYLEGQRIMASAYGARGGGRGQITDDDIYKAYNRNMEKDNFGDFKKQFPDFSVYRNYILQQMSGQPVAPNGIKFLGFEK